MNWPLFFKYFALIPTILVAVDSIAGAIASGQPAATPGLSTYLEGKHVLISLHVDPAP